MDCVKKICPHQCAWASSNPLGRCRTKRWRKVKFSLSLSLSWGIPLLLPSDIRAPGVLAFGLRDSHQLLVPSPPGPPFRFSCLWPQTGHYVISNPASQAFRLGLNYSAVSPRSSPCRQQNLGLLGLHNHVSQFLTVNLSLLYTCVYVCVCGEREREI